ncbi:MAG: PAS domain-containing protein [Candidatus Binatia bacterium]
MSLLAIGGVVQSFVQSVVESFVRVVTSDRAGGVTARRLLIAAIIIPWGLGWACFWGERAGLYSTATGFQLVAIATTGLLAAVVWWHASTLDGADRQRAAAETALRDGEERLRAILDNANALVYLKDLDGRLLFINRQCEAVFHVPRAQALGHTFDEFFPGPAAEALRANDHRILASGQPLEFEEQVGHDDGVHTYVSIKFPIVDSQGTAYALCGISTDITARKRMEEALQESEARLTLALDAARMGLWDLDLVTDSTYRTVTHDQIFGYATLLPAWGRETFFSHVFPEDREMVGDRFAEAGATGVFRVECRIVRHDDRSIRWISAEGRAFRNERGEAVRMMGSIADVTERKRAEALLHQRTLQLEVANEALGSFTYTVSHDLRAPLRAIDGYANILVEDHAASLDGNARRALGVICDNARQMGRLIDDLLTFSRLGRSELAKCAVDMTALVHAVVENLRRVEPTRAVTVNVDMLLPARADGSMIRQVLANLIGNAWKFTRNAAAPTITIGCRRGAAETIYFVSDNGAGFEMAYADKLFGVFQRLHRPDEFEGTGVGLAIVQRIVQRHGGRAWAEGAIGHGATFSFSLPLTGDVDAVEVL